MFCSRRISCSLAPSFFLAVLVLQVQFIRGQLTHNFAWEGRSVIAEPAFKVGKILNKRDSILRHLPETPKIEFKNTTRSRVLLTSFEVFEIVAELTISIVLTVKTKVKEKAEEKNRKRYSNKSFKVKSRMISITSLLPQLKEHI